MRLWSLMTALALTCAAPSAFALTMCTDASKCETNEACHGGYCLPKASQCTSDAGCKPHQVCDMTCPHGGWASGSTGTATSGSTGSGEPSSSEDKAGSGSSGSGESGSGAMPEPSDGGPDNGTSEQSPPCPTDVGICVVKMDKIQPTTACIALCDAAAACNLGGGSGGSEPPKTTEPAPAPGTDGDSADGGSSDEGSSGSSGSGSSGSGGADTPDGGSSGAPMPIDDKDGSEPEDVPDNGTDDKESCLAMCSVLELEGIGKAEMAALGACVEANKAGGCGQIESNCTTQAEAAEKAIEADEDKLELVMAGFGGTSPEASGGGSTSKDVGTGVPEQGGGTGSSNTAGGGDSGAGSSDAQSGSGTAAGDATSAGCTAAPVGQNGGFGLVLLALVALLWRRREAQA